MQDQPRNGKNNTREFPVRKNEGIRTRNVMLVEDGQKPRLVPNQEAQEIAKSRKRIILEGDVPSPLHMPSGCAFRTRCKYATEQCAQECPKLTDRGNGHLVACWNK